MWLLAQPNNHVNYISFAYRIGCHSACKWLQFLQPKRKNNVISCGGRLAGGAGKANVLLVAVLTAKAHRKKRKRISGGEERKNLGRNTDFLQTLHSHFSSLKAWNPSLSIGGGRGMLCLLWKQILALDSNQKDLNRRFKVAIMDCQILTTQGCLSWPL